MLKLDTTVDINNTPENVFDWIRSPEHARQWMTSVTETEILEEHPGMVGTTFRERVQENGRSTELFGEITGYVPDQMISFHLEGRYNEASVVFHVHRIDSGTRVTQSARLKFKSFSRIMMIFGSIILKRKILKQMQRELGALKELCEQHRS